ncbi:MAG TPA: DUF3450 family protein [Sulfurovum sp.]|nr:DUF3450 family protein [Sulfurovum sp.]
MITIRRKALYMMLFVGTLGSSSLLAKSSENMIQSIMKLRGDVEALYSKVDDNKDDYKAQMKSYVLQISDNEAQINRKETELKLTQQNLAKVASELQTIGSSVKDIKPIIHTALALLAKEVQAGIPFKTEERLGALEKIKTDLKNGDITQEKALALTWASYDDALRLTKEIGLFKQEVTIEGESKLAKIAKIGSVMMFFATPDDKVGYVKQENNAYTYVVATEDDDITHIVHLFDALQKQIRTGYFTLPNALLLRGVN